MREVPAIGIDFGTTNSSVALATGGSNVELLRFPAGGAFTAAYRSLLYLEHHQERGRITIKSWPGPRAIERVSGGGDQRSADSVVEELPDQPQLDDDGCLQAPARWRN